MRITARRNLKVSEKSQEIRPEVTKLIKELSKKYAGVWKDLAKV